MVPSPEQSRKHAARILMIFNEKDVHGSIALDCMRPALDQPRTSSETDQTKSLDAS
jgi:hypothetical protein